MKQIKIYSFVFYLMLMIFPFHVQAAEDVEKDEVVYAVMNANGLYDQLFVINTFELLRDGKYKDYGDYTSVKNVTDVSEIKVNQDEVIFTGNKGIFHYEGILEDVALPWQFTFTYFLDGKEVSAESLAGESGRLKIKIAVEENKESKKEFFEHYIVQIGASFPMDDTNRLRAEDGMIANAGDDYQVQFTVMPEEEVTFFLEADVRDFSFKGFEMNAVPSFINVDEPDVDEMEGDMNTLQKAIHDINNGVLQLRNGLAAFQDGAAELYDGSTRYKAGMDELSSEVTAASKDLDDAFQQFDQVIQEMDGISVKEVEDALGALQAFPNELKQLRKEIAQMRDDFQDSFSTLREAVQSIPSESLTKGQIDALKDSGIEEETIAILLASYEAGKAVQSAFKEVEQSEKEVQSLFENMLQNLDEIIHLADELGADLAGVTNVSDILADVARISNSYELFRDGITDLTAGILVLGHGYGEIHDGIGALSTSSQQLEDGATELYDGTSKLKKGTDDLPDKLKEEIDALMEKYDKSDFDMVSFVSSKNKKVEKVQFVMKTAAIEQTEEEVETVQKENKSMWQRFLDLFSFLKFWG